MNTVFKSPPGTFSVRQRGAPLETCRHTPESNIAESNGPVTIFSPRASFPARTKYPPWLSRMPASRAWSRARIAGRRMRWCSSPSAGGRRSIAQCDSRRTTFTDALAELRRALWEVAYAAVRDSKNRNHSISSGQAELDREIAKVVQALATRFGTW